MKVEIPVNHLRLGDIIQGGDNNPYKVYGLPYLSSQGIVRVPVRRADVENEISHLFGYRPDLHITVEREDGKSE